MKAFFKEKGLFLVCMALVFAATITGILAIRTVVDNVTELTKARQKAVEEDNTWNAPDAIVNNPVTDLPEETPAPSSAVSAQDSAQSGAASSSSPSSQPAAKQQDSGTQGSSAAKQGTLSGSPFTAKPSVPFSGEELVYNATLQDWRTHNGADYACAAGTAIPALHGGTVTLAEEDALWGGVVEVSTDDGFLWRYCGLGEPAVKTGDTVTAGQQLGEASAVPSEADTDPHIHLECLKDEAYLDPEANQ